MFGKLKDLAEMKKQAGQMRAALAGEQVETETGGVKIVMNGNMEILSVTVEENLSKQDIEKAVQEAVNQSFKKVQQLMASKMMGNM